MTPSPVLALAAVLALQAPERPAPTSALPLTVTPTRPLGTLREQAALQHEWLRYRLDSVLPRLMRQYGVDMWIISMREYNEDPMFWGLVPATTFFARRRSIYVFFDRGPPPAHGVERLALGGGTQGGLYRAYVARDTVDPSIGRRPELVGQGQWDLLTRFVRERNPRTIAVNISHTHAFADGLSAGEWERLQQALPPEYRARVVRAEGLALDYQAIRAPAMLPAYRRLMAIVWAVIDTAFSNRVITPGRTTTEDVVWWMRQRVNDLGLGTWFHPDVDVQRRGVDLSDSALVVIRRGDVLHCDFGITALGLNTDTQHMGYVLREGERDVPAGLRRALANSNRLQDLLLAEMRPGRSGNEVLAATLAAMRAAGINGTVYTHPIGDRGHGAGPLIGLWDHQEGVPGRGAVPLLPGTWFSIELQASTPVPEWDGQLVRSAQEEDAALGPDGVMRWILRRQTRFHVVR
ncbi:MAG: M24 family metallopeptidase [Gemmatimonadales bacterium]